MNISENIKVALQSVRANLLRSFLTLLIIATGIMALVGILTAIDSIIYSMSDNFTSLGANSFTIEPLDDRVKGSRKRGRRKIGNPVSFEEAMEFKERFEFPSSMVSVSVPGTGMATVKYENEKTNPNVRIYGIDENEFKIRKHKIEYGRYFSGGELETGSNKAVIGTEIVKLLFNKNAQYALGKDVTIGNVKYRVVGVLKPKGTGMGSSNDNKVYIPLLNAKRYYGSPRKNYNISIGVSTAEYMDMAVSTATGVFRNVRKLKTIDKEDFTIFKSDGLISILKENTVVLRYATIFIALITLLGAAIGLMNIMLVSVTERTREIGICKALGATRKNILIQFLTEAIVICLMGGILGIILGILAGNAVSYFTAGSFLIPWTWMTLGITLCIIVGLLSGLYPALKASRLDPIESLRYE